MGRLTRLDPVPVHDVIRLYRQTMLMKSPAMKSVATLHATRCRTYGMVDEADRLIAALLFYRHDPADRVVDLAFLVSETIDVRPFIPAGIALARLTIAEVLQDGTVTLRAVVRVDHPPGHRLAALVGFEPVDERDGQMIYERGPHGTGHGNDHRRQGQKGSQAPGRVVEGTGSRRAGAPGAVDAESGSRYGDLDGGDKESAARQAAPPR